MTRSVVETVTGPIAPGSLGITLAHEHLFIDLRCLFDAADDAFSRSIAEQPVDGVPRSRLEHRPYRSRDNLILDDEQTAATELAAFAEAGGRSLIDLTVDGIAPNPEGLRRLSLRSGVQVVAGAGIYIARAHPPWVATASTEELVQRLIRSAEVGIGGTTVKAGVFGELGTSSPIHPDEVKVLRAAARAHLATDISINVHCALWAREGLRVLDILQAEGVGPRRVALSHMDELLDLDYHVALARRGAWLSFDTWGSTFDFGANREPSDEERLTHLLDMIKAGYAGQILLAHDACTKLNLHRYGGKGIAYLLTVIKPRLEQEGVPADTIRSLFVDNPQRYLVGS